MRVTKAYIASTGTAAVMVAASLSVFVFLSAYIAFGSWPGAHSNTSVDQIVLRSVQRSHTSPIAVRKDAVAVARREAARQAARTVALAQPRGAGGNPAAPGSRVIQVPSRQVASAPVKSGGPTTQVQKTTKPVTDTTQQVTQQVQTQVQNVQTQVNDVVNQVTGGGAPTGSSTSPVQQVQDTVDSVIGH